MGLPPGTSAVFLIANLVKRRRLGGIFVSGMYVCILYESVMPVLAFSRDSMFKIQHSQTI
jgi:hypothetical protein